VSRVEPAAGGAHFQLYRSSGGTLIGWRLLGGNHRSIGRSAVSYPAAAECLSSVKEVIEQIEELECVVSRAPLNRWEWRLRHRAGHRVPSLGDPASPRCTDAAVVSTAFSPAPDRQPFVAANQPPVHLDQRRSVRPGPPPAGWQFLPSLETK